MSKTARSWERGHRVGDEKSLETRVEFQLALSKNGLSAWIAANKPRLKVNGEGHSPSKPTDAITK